MRILLTNTVALNGGEGATVCAIVELLHATFGRDAEVIVYEHRPEAAARFYPDLNFRRLLYDHVSHRPRIRRVGDWIARANRARFRRALARWCSGDQRSARRWLTAEECRDLELYSSADLVVSSGGTYLVANYDIAPRLFDYDVTLAFGRPLVFFTQSMGPFRPDTREPLRRVFEQARLILLRDEGSLGHLRALGVENPDVHLSADAVFAMGADDAPDTAEPSAGSSAGPAPRADVNAAGHAGGGPPRVALSVRHWHYFKRHSQDEGMRRYRAAIAAAVDHLVRVHRADVTFVSTCQGVPEYWFDDASVAREIHALLDPGIRGRVRVDDRFRRPREMIAELRKYDLVIGTRFHMAILAMLADVPPLAIEYEFKTAELYRNLELPDWVHDIETIEPHAFCAHVDRCLAQRDEARRILRRGVARERRRALAAGELLKRALVSPESDRPRASAVARRAERVTA